jgi:D-3-phosphoglycerate dehydrogenase
MEKMKDGVILLNLSRAELVDAEAVKAALDSGKIKKYVTDFATDELLGYPGVITLPHLGASTPESEDNCAIMAARELSDYIENGNITNSVNMPSASMPRKGDPRLCVIHKNVPDVIAKITGILSSGSVNIENMMTAGRREMKYAYTMIDMDTVPQGLEKAVAAIEDVIRVRIV